MKVVIKRGLFSSFPCSPCDSALGTKLWSLFNSDGIFFEKVQSVCPHGHHVLELPKNAAVTRDLMLSSCLQVSSILFFLHLLSELIGFQKNAVENFHNSLFKPFWVDDPQNC